MDLTLNVSDFGFGTLGRDLGQWAANADDARPALEQVADDFLDWEGRQFSSEGRYGSAGWAPLAQSTVRRRGSAHPILHEHGDLEAALTRKGAQNSIRDITVDTARLGTSDPKAIYHQKGTTRMPARPPVPPPTPADRARIGERVRAHLGINGPPTATSTTDTQLIDTSSVAGAA